MKVNLIAKRTIGHVIEGTIVEKELQAVLDKGTYYSLLTHSNSEIRFDKKNWEIIFCDNIKVEDVLLHPHTETRCFVYSDGKHYFYKDEYENFEKIHYICDIDEDYILNIVDMFLLG